MSGGQDGVIRAASPEAISRSYRFTSAAHPQFGSTDLSLAFVALPVFSVPSRSSRGSSLLFVPPRG